MGNIRRVILLGSIPVERAAGALADAEESSVFGNAYVELGWRGNGGQ